jgi:hypothetical protein
MLAGMLLILVVVMATTVVAMCRREWIIANLLIVCDLVAVAPLVMVYRNRGNS